VTVDVVPWLTRATLDIIGLAGFGYSFGSLTNIRETNELEEAFKFAFGALQEAPILALLSMFIPGFRKLVSSYHSYWSNVILGLTMRLNPAIQA
jgi:hypothetical protein